MAYVPEIKDIRRNEPTVREKVRSLEKQLNLEKMNRESEEQKKPWRIPFKWNWKFRQQRQKNQADKVLVMFMNKKNEIEPPTFLPVHAGNMVVYKHKAYVFDPRAIWRLKVKGYPMVYVIREIDRQPVMNRYGQVYYADSALSNNDIEEVRARGDSTESDEFLVKLALKAQTSKLEGKTNWIVAGIVLIVVVGGLIWFLSKGPNI